eukprot:scaffold36642_cov50-Phaeocystis_antarctica.AAC.2
MYALPRGAHPALCRTLCAQKKCCSDNQLGNFSSRYFHLSSQLPTVSLSTPSATQLPSRGRVWPALPLGLHPGAPTSGLTRRAARR